MIIGPEQKARVAILGSNGQVGTELSYLLSTELGIHPVAVARSEYSLALLRKMGLECRVAVSDVDLADVLRECAAVVDLVHPWQTNTSEMRRSVIARCRFLHDNTPAGAPIIYASTLAVHRLDPEKPAYSIYGKTKQLAEREHLRIGAQTGRPVVVMRLGEVHGALQGVSLSLIDTLRRVPRVVVPDLSSISVFVATISEAIALTVAGNVPTGTYNLVSHPDWSYADLTLWLIQEAGANVDIIKEPVARPLGALARGLQSVKGSAWSNALRHKDQITDWMWSIAPQLAGRAAFEHSQKLAAAQIIAYKDSQVVRLFSPIGPVDGARIKGLSDSRITMPVKQALMKAAVSQLTA